jgi:antitoxin component of RelBE/YafQ-DinJ toxin-antitoxin module
MGTTRFTAEVDSETLARAREILNREQITLDETLQEMLSHIVSHDTAPCFRCGEPNPETQQAMAEAEAGDLITSDTIADLFTDLNEED